MPHEQRGFLSKDLNLLGVPMVPIVDDLVRIFADIDRAKDANRTDLEASLTAKQYRRHIKQLGLNLSSAADFLDISYRTSRRLGDTTADAPIPRAVAMVLRLALRYQIKPEVMVDKFGD
jgi:hypothetical protein